MPAPSAFRQSRRGENPPARVAAAVVLLLLAAPAAAEPPRPVADAEARRLLGAIVSSTSLRWQLRGWERSGGKTEETLTRCAWSAPDRLELEVLEGRGKGARMVAQGERVSVRPPGLLGWMTLDYPLDEPTVRSLRGNTLREAGLATRAAALLAELPRATVSQLPGGALGIELVDGGARVRATLRWSGPRSLHYERWENGELVERADYLEIGLGPK